MMDFEENMVYITYERKGNLIVNTLGHHILDIVRFSAPFYRTTTIFSALGFSLLVTSVAFGRKEEEGERRGEGRGKKEALM